MGYQEGFNQYASDHSGGAAASKTLRFSESEAVKHIDLAIAAAIEASGWADSDESSMLGDVVKELTHIKENITGEW